MIFLKTFCNLLDKVNFCVVKLLCIVLCLISLHEPGSIIKSGQPGCIQGIIRIIVDVVSSVGNIE